MSEQQTPQKKQNIVRFPTSKKERRKLLQERKDKRVQLVRTLRRACGWILEYQRPETVCGLVRQIGREGESMEILTLGELCETAVDMFTTVFVGNSCTRQVGGRMVTPRGYRNE